MNKTARYLYSDGKFRLVNSFNASTMMQVFNYGTAAFEGMKAFYRRKEDNWFIFRPDQHYERIKRSASMLEIDIDFDRAEFIKIISELIKKNNIKTDVYIRPLVYRNKKGVGLIRPSGYGFSIFIEPAPHKSPKKFSCCLVSQRRPTDGTYNIKLSGNYLLSFFAQKEAMAKGFDIGILQSVDGYISEASVMNLFFLRNGNIYTPDLECGPLDGITRKSVIQILKEHYRLKVNEGKYKFRSLMTADEIFLTGTGSGINFIKKLNSKEFGNINGYNLGLKIHKTYKTIIYGQLKKYQDWLYPVQD